jgi:hypothetical protein
MAGNSKKFILFLVFGIWLMLACQLTDDLGLTGSNAAAADPRSSFVPHREILTVDLEEQMIIETYHMSKNRFGSLEILVNQQPVTDNGSATNNELASVAVATIKILAPTAEYANGVCIGDKCDVLSTTTISITSDPIVILPIQSEYPNNTWNVPLMWTGHVPGTYDLTMVVTDNAGKQGERLTQRIEVKKATP